MKFSSYVCALGLLTAPCFESHANFQDGFVYGVVIGTVHGLANKFCESRFTTLPSSLYKIPFFLATSSKEGEYVIAHSERPPVQLNFFIASDKNPTVTFSPCTVDQDRLAGVLLGHGIAQSLIEGSRRTDQGMEFGIAFNLNLLAGVCAALHRWFPAS